MKMIINLIASITFLFQFVFAIFNILNMRRPGTLLETLHNDFVFFSCLCSFSVVPIFALLFNFKYKYLNKTFINILFIIITIVAAYAHICQIFILKDLILVACILLSFDFYIAFKLHKQVKGNAKID